MLEKKIRDLIPCELNNLMVKNEIIFSLQRKRNILMCNLFRKNISYDLVFSSDLTTCSIKISSQIGNFQKSQNKDLEILTSFLNFLNDNIDFIRLSLSQELAKAEDMSRNKFYNSLETRQSNKNSKLPDFHFKVFNTITEDTSCTNRTGKDNVFYYSRNSTYQIENVDKMDDSTRQVIHRGLEKLKSYKNNSEYSYSRCREPTSITTKKLSFFLTRKITSIHNRAHKLVDFTIIFDQYLKNEKDLKVAYYLDRYYTDDLTFYSTLIKTLLFLIINKKDKLNVRNEFFWSDIEVFIEKYKYPTQNSAFQNSTFQDIISVKDHEGFTSGIRSLINFYKENNREIEEKIKIFLNEEILENYIFNSYFDYEILVPQIIKDYFVK